MDYWEMINEISERCIKNTENVIIIGANASGKTEILKQVYLKTRSSYNCYLIDSVNRKFCLKNIVFQEEIGFPHYEKVVERRFDMDTYNLKDSFYDRQIERILGTKGFRRKYEKILTEYFGKRVFFDKKKSTRESAIALGEYVNEVNIGNRVITEEDIEGERLSDGQQGLLRIILELQYYDYMMSLKNHMNNKFDTDSKIVLIDELDIYLDKWNAHCLFDFLIDKYKDIKFVITTHSSDVLYGTKKGEIISIVNRSSSGSENDHRDYYIYSAKDIDTISSAENIINMTNHEPETKKSNNDEEARLSTLFNHAIAGGLNKEEMEVLNSISKKDLSNVERLIYNSIKEINRKNDE